MDTVRFTADCVSRMASVIPFFPSAAVWRAQRELEKPDFKKRFDIIYGAKPGENVDKKLDELREQEELQRESALAREREAWPYPTSGVGEVVHAIIELTDWDRHKILWLTEAAILTLREWRGIPCLRDLMAVYPGVRDVNH
jgi:hypothetical protein